MRATLRRARLRAGLSQAELARRVGLSRPAYTNIEKGHKHPSLVTALRIARVLNRQVEELFSDELAGDKLMNVSTVVGARARIGRRTPACKG